MQGLIWKHIWKYNKVFFFSPPHTRSPASLITLSRIFLFKTSLVKFVMFMCFKMHFSCFIFEFNLENQFNTMYCRAARKQSCKTCYRHHHMLFSVFLFLQRASSVTSPLTFWGKQVKPRLKQEEMHCEIQRCSNSLMKRFYKRIGWLAKSEHEKYPTSTLTHIIHYVWWLWE